MNTLNNPWDIDMYTWTWHVHENIYLIYTAEINSFNYFPYDRS